MGEKAYTIMPSDDSEKDPVKKFEALTGDLNNAGTEVNKFSGSFTDEAIKKVDDIFGKKIKSEMPVENNDSNGQKSKVLELESLGKREPSEDEVRVELERIMRDLVLAEKQLRTQPEAIKKITRGNIEKNIKNMPSKEKWEEKFGNEFFSIGEVKKRIDLIV